MYGRSWLAEGPGPTRPLPSTASDDRAVQNTASVARDHVTPQPVSAELPTLPIARESCSSVPAMNESSSAVLPLGCTQDGAWLPVDRPDVVDADAECLCETERCRDAEVASQFGSRERDSRDARCGGELLLRHPADGSPACERMGWCGHGGDPTKRSGQPVSACNECDTEIHSGRTTTDCPGRPRKRPPGRGHRRFRSHDAPHGTHAG